MNGLKKYSMFYHGECGKPKKNQKKTIYPLVNVHITMENHHFVAGKIHYFYGHFQ